MKRLLYDVVYLINAFDKYELSFQHKIKKLCELLLSLFSKQKRVTQVGLDIMVIGDRESCDKIGQELFSQIILLSQMS